MSQFIASGKISLVNSFGSKLRYCHCQKLHKKWLSANQKQARLTIFPLINQKLLNCNKCPPQKPRRKIYTMEKKPNRPKPSQQYFISKTQSEKPKEIISKTQSFPNSKPISSINLLKYSIECLQSFSLKSLIKDSPLKDEFTLIFFPISNSLSKQRNKSTH